MSIAAATRIGLVSLSVSDLARSVDYYCQVIGLQVIKQHPGEVVLGAGGTSLLSLHEIPGAAHVPKTTGLYHFALLVPTRFELARTLRNLVENQAVFVGFADHHVSEAIYLSDPDGHGIEIYRDRPREQWLDSSGNFQLTTDPLDVRGLLEEIASGAPAWDGIHPATTMGHIHLHVDYIPQARVFYRDVLGFEVMADMQSALFLSAGGYHHHIGVNTWNGLGAPPPPPNSLRLLSYEILLPDEQTLAETVVSLENKGLQFQRTANSLEFQDSAANTVILRSA